ncbi:MAG TPA: hypothetical protein VHI54_03760 [Actinomycetota bacterium]|nr:hypothetical protein [Actinomycetota bacterium]
MADVPPPPAVPPPPSGDPALPPRSFGDIFSTALDIYRKNALQLFAIVAIVVIPLTIIGYIIVRAITDTDTTTQTIGGQTFTVQESPGLFVFLLAALISAAIGVIINAILQAALLRGAAGATLGERVDISDSYRWGLRRFGSVLWVSFLVAIIVGVGFLLLIIPGLIFLAMLAVAVPSVVMEGQRGTKALGRSWNLVKGHFWHVFGVVVVAAIIVQVVNSILTRIGGDSVTFALIMQTIGQIITAPFSALVTIVLYLDLRTRVENLTVTQLRGELERA